MSGQEVATNLLGRLVTMKIEHIWVDSWCGFSKWRQDPEFLPRRMDGSLLPARIIAVWKDPVAPGKESKIRIAAEMLAEPQEEDGGRGGIVHEFWLEHVKLVPEKENEEAQ